MDVPYSSNLYDFNKKASYDPHFRNPFADLENTKPVPGDTTPEVSAQGNLIAAGMFTQMFATIGNTIAQSIALDSQAAYKKQQSDFNAHMAQLSAQEAIQNGNFQANQIQRTANAEVGSARTQTAAAGVLVDSGSSADVQNSIKSVSSVDVLTAKNNAARKAYGFQVQSNADTTEGQIAENMGKINEATTILGGSITALGSGMKGYYYGSGGTIAGKEKGI